MDTVADFVKHMFGFDAEEEEDFDKKPEDQVSSIINCTSFYYILK